jgi:hypothetical protein|tara:strand:+ start:158 stop:298 length:141 start_codon:yes stop_codon:yes gene_type:complete
VCERERDIYRERELFVSHNALLLLLVVTKKKKKKKKKNEAHANTIL